MNQGIGRPQVSKRRHWPSRGNQTWPSTSTIGSMKMARAPPTMHSAGMAGVAADPKFRAVIFTGRGDKAFSAGADMAQFEEQCAKQAELPPMYFQFAAKADLLALETLPKPVISAINGTAVGEGLEICMAADFRIMARSARIGFPDADLSLIP